MCRFEQILALKWPSSWGVCFTTSGRTVLSLVHTAYMGRVHSRGDRMQSRSGIHEAIGGPWLLSGR